MLDIPRINSRIPLKIEISKLKNPTKETVRDLYGTFGLDILEKKQSLTIISKRDIGFLSKVKNWLTGNSFKDFEEGDTLKDVVFKYAGNKECGLVDDIETMFGKKGLKALESLARLGYIEL